MAAVHAPTSLILTLVVCYQVDQLHLLLLSSEAEVAVTLAVAYWSRLGLCLQVLRASGSDLIGISVKEQKNMNCLNTNIRNILA